MPVITPDESGMITVKQAAQLCRVTEMTVRNWYNRGWHDEDGVWFHSRCDGCGDECTREDYDVNAKRWVAYEKACRAAPVLGGLEHAA